VRYGTCLICLEQATALALKTPIKCRPRNPTFHSCTKTPICINKPSVVVGLLQTSGITHPRLRWPVHVITRVPSLAKRRKCAKFGHLRCRTTACQTSSVSTSPLLHPLVPSINTCALLPTLYHERLTKSRITAPTKKGHNPHPHQWLTISNSASTPMRVR
jgi:hypothetical protein